MAFLGVLLGLIARVADRAMCRYLAEASAPVVKLVQLMIAELGLRASGTPSRELPGWGKVTKMVVTPCSGKSRGSLTWAPRVPR